MRVHIEKTERFTLASPFYYIYIYLKNVYKNPIILYTVKQIKSTPKMYLERREKL